MKELENKSKAETLVALSKKISGVNIPKTFYFSVSDLKNNKNRILRNVNNQFKKFIAVRSSNKYKDNRTTPNA